MYSWMLITGDTPVTTDALAFRESLGSFPTGVCLVTTLGEGGKREGMTINSFASVSLSPPLILWSIREAARSAEAFIAARHFVLSVLAASQQHLAMHFARPAPDKFSDWEAQFEPGLAGCPRLKDYVAMFECTTYSRHQEGDHTILLGRVESHQRTSRAPLLLHMGRMGSLWDLAEAHKADPRLEPSR